MAKEHIAVISPKSEDSHKGDYGKLFIIAGSPGLTGAAYLSSQAAIRTGSGVVTLGVPASLNVILETKLTEVMTIPLAETEGYSLGLKAEEKILDFSKKCDVVALGPGLGKDKETHLLIRSLVENLDRPLVIDADGLNAIGTDLDIIKNRNETTVLTPHPGEMARLVGASIDDVQENRETMAKDLAVQTGAIVCLKGHKSVVADPEGSIYTNTTGNSGMSTAGCGDVLTGMIASFIGQDIFAYSATIAAVYLHGLAGDIAAENMGSFSMIASDIIDSISEAFDKAGI